MKRKAIKELRAWKAMPDRKPLLLEGARQVGKTYLLEQLFGNQEYENVVRVNLQNATPQLREMFDGSIDPIRIINNLELLYSVKIQPDKTLLVFDEIQDVPRALTALKYFRENAPEYHVAAAGSLLGVFLQQQSSFPVGQVHTVRLEPMDFEEFCWANGREGVVASLEKDNSNHLFDELLLDLFRQYLIIGGMPEVVQRWVQNHDMEQAQTLQQSILNDYIKDFSKYASEQQAIRIRQVFETLPSQFAKSNSKFAYGAVKAGARAREYELAIEWLVNAGLVRRIYNVSVGDKIPLKSYIDQSAFKLYFVDCGLLRQLAEIPPSVILNKLAIFDEFNGLFAEQFVLQQIHPRKAYYWTGSTTAKVEFVIQDESVIVPIEVKSGENVKSKSLRVYRDKYHPALAVRFSLKGLEMNGGLLNIPLYYSFLFEGLLASTGRA
jgi:predicted AAA+ superfamily ATPase